MQRKNFPPKHVDPVNYHVEEEEEDEEEEFDLVEAMNEMTVHERRKVYALKGLLNDYKNVRAKFREELALLQVEFMQSTQGLRDVRSDIVRGVRDINEEELARVKELNAVKTGIRELSSDDEDNEEERRAAGQTTTTTGGKEAKATKSVSVVAPQEAGRLEKAAADPNGGIPDFWLTAMCNTEVLDTMITERDRHALSFLRDVTLEYLEGDPQKGVQLNFHFAPNEYFTNTVLSKTFHMSFNEDSGEEEIDTLKSTSIEWTSPEKNLTIVIKSKKQRHKSSKSIRVVKREEKCPSFFDFFSSPFGEDEEKDEKAAADDDDDEDEEKAELQIEAGQLLMEELVPKAAFYYTGKSVEQAARQLQSQLDFQMFAGDDDDDEEEEEDEDYEDAAEAGEARFIQARGGPRARGGAGAPRGGGKPQECKQQ